MSSLHHALQTSRYFAAPFLSQAKLITFHSSLMTHHFHHSSSAFQLVPIPTRSQKNSTFHSFLPQSFASLLPALFDVLGVAEAGLEGWETVPCQVRPPFIVVMFTYPIGSMGLWYIYQLIDPIKANGIHAGKYTSPVDSMGAKKSPHPSCFEMENVGGCTRMQIPSVTPTYPQKV